MPITSPDLLPSPDRGSPFTFSADITALANAVQVALEKRGNSYRGTNASMVAALSAVPRGSYWFNTTDNKTYRRGLTAWGIWDEPTWTNMSMIASVAQATPTGTPPGYIIRGGRVQFRGVIVLGTGGNIPSFTNMSTIPTAYQPGDITSGVALFHQPYNTAANAYLSVGLRFLAGGSPQIVSTINAAGTQIYLNGISYETTLVL